MDGNNVFIVSDKTKFKKDYAAQVGILASETDIPFELGLAIGTDKDLYVKLATFAEKFSDVTVDVDSLNSENVGNQKYTIKNILGLAMYEELHIGRMNAVNTGRVAKWLADLVKRNIDAKKIAMVLVEAEDKAGLVFSNPAEVVFENALIRNESNRLFTEAMRKEKEYAVEQIDKLLDILISKEIDIVDGRVDKLLDSIAEISEQAMGNPKCYKLLNLKLGNTTTDKAVYTFLPEEIVDMFPPAINGYRPEKELIKIYVKAYVIENNLVTFMSATDQILVNNILTKNEKESRLEVCRCFRDGNEERIREKIAISIARIYTRNSKKPLDEQVNLRFERAKKCYERGLDPFGEEFSKEEGELLMAEM